ncbi:MAG: hypothetical protein H6828_12135 [Planctomycetes bacterium]|nr:hypothetical protein [Planctomycetota bacterium]
MALGALGASAVAGLEVLWLRVLPHAGPVGPFWLRRLVCWAPLLAASVVSVRRLLFGRRAVLRWAYLGAAPVLLLAALVLWLSVEDLRVARRRPFDRDAWLASGADSFDSSAWTERQYMVDELIRTGQLDGLHREEVLELLGPPTDEGEAWVQYTLGAERGILPIDGEALLIGLSEDGRVASARTRSD